MKLIDLYTVPDAADVLWQLLHERPPEANISHRRMPTLAQHAEFIASRPYFAWYLLDIGEDDFAGAVYLTSAREIGIGILKRFWGFGYGKMAVRLLLDKHPGKALANIAPRNFVSQAMFADLGFRLVQHTFELQGAS